jgi:2-oxoglutarate dehydrogenase E2 component (dihydrolipoamide succinyltransferase)
LVLCCLHLLSILHNQGLGMHNIERPIAVNGKVEIHPMMYALVWSHRIIDGKESVGFLVAIKEALENPMEFYWITT